jgi:hypothetical protein
LLTRIILAKIMKQSGLLLRVEGVLPEDFEATMCSGNNQVKHHISHGVSQRSKTIKPADYNLMIQLFV